MKRFLILILTALAAAGQPAAAATRISEPLRPSQQSAAMRMARDLLLEAVRFERDGTAVSHTIRRGISTRIEWRNLIFRQLILGSVTQADRERGVGRRLYAQIGGDAYRLVDAFGPGPWRYGSYPGFPGFFVIEEIHGEIVVTAPGLDDFEPRPRRSPSSPGRQPAGDGGVVARTL